MVSRKGLSNIVATVLIVLLALAAIAIVWGFVGQTINDASSRGGLSSACLAIQLEPVRCTLNGTNASVLYKLNSEADEMFSRVAVVIEDANRATYVNGSAPAPRGALVTQSAVVSGIGSASPFKARVAAVVSDETTEQTCQETIEVDCQ